MTSLSVHVIGACDVPDRTGVCNFEFINTRARAREIGCTLFLALFFNPLSHYSLLFVLLPGDFLLNIVDFCTSLGHND